MLLKFYIIRNGSRLMRRISKYFSEIASIVDSKKDEYSVIFAFLMSVFFFSKNCIWETTVVKVVNYDQNNKLRYLKAT